VLLWHLHLGPGGRPHSALFLPHLPLQRPAADRGAGVHGSNVLHQRHVSLGWCVLLPWSNFTPCPRLHTSVGVVPPPPPLLSLLPIPRLQAFPLSLPPGTLESPLPGVFLRIARNSLSTPTTHRRTLHFFVASPSTLASPTLINPTNLPCGLPHCPYMFPPPPHSPTLCRR
jgi:hypothetical protein